MKTDTRPKIPPPLDPGFQPAALFTRRYAKALRQSGAAEPLVVGLERENGLLSRFEIAVRSSDDADTFRYAERVVKFLLWSRGAWRLWLGGPPPVCERIRRCYAGAGVRRFDAGLMRRVYGRPFDVRVVDAQSVPDAREAPTPLGGHLDGCRIGFDLGASDFKIAAVCDGRVVYSEESPWDPREQADPEYHYGRLSDGLKKARAHLPRVDAIGGSSAGVIVDNRIMVASLFRSVPDTKSEQATNLFLRLRDEWGVPLTVANDGDVTALAGAMSLGSNGMLGIAMGSSEAAGYINPRGCMTGWLTELAFAPVDYNADASRDEWSGDCGVGAMYFSQQAVNRLLPAAGIRLPDAQPLPERLEQVQRLMARGDHRAAGIYETIGAYLGYTIPHYADFYDFTHLLILGRVTTGPGGDSILEKAREVLKAEFPEEAERIHLHVPDEQSRRVGQAVAAASLPYLKQ